MKQVTNFALLSHEEDIIWKFGRLQDSDFELNVSGFLRGLDSLGRELFGEGIASIKINRDYNASGVHEVFCVNLEGKFLFLITDPLVTVKLLEMEKIDSDIDLQLRGVLAAQGAILYSNLSSTDEYFSSMNTIDEMFQTALIGADVSNPERLVGQGSCSLASLTTPELLIFHYLLRENFRKHLDALQPVPWAIIAESSGRQIFLDYNVPENIQVLSGYLSVIVSFVDELFHATPQNLTFGGDNLVNLETFCSRDYFLAACHPRELFQKEDFINQLLNAPHLDVIVSQISSYLCSDLAHMYKKEIQRLPISDLCNIYRKFSQKGHQQNRKM